MTTNISFHPDNPNLELALTKNFRTESHSQMVTGEKVEE